MIRKLSLLLGMGALFVGATSEARTQLTPSPVREFATLQLSPSGYHLVNEKRSVGLLKGTNIVSFTWKNVSIDDASLVLTPLNNQDAVRLIGLTYPPNESGAVLAEIYSDRDVVTTFQVSYLLGNLEREISYLSTVTVDGKKWKISREGTVFNRSGERFNQVKVDLGDGLTYSGPLDHPEGRKVQKGTGGEMPIKPVYRLTLRDMPMVGGAPQPLNPAFLYELKNDSTISPTKAALSPGKMRLFQNDRQGTQAFTGEDRIPTLAFGEKTELSIGTAQDIRIKWFLDEDEERNAEKARRSSLDTDRYTVRADRYQKIRMELKNFKDEAVQVLVTIPAAYRSGVKVLESTHPTKMEKNYYDGVTVVVDLPPGGKEVKSVVELLYQDYVFNNY